MTILLPKNVIECLEILETNGFEAFCVGGAIRDCLLKLTPEDYDITTNALPEDIMRIFPHTVPTGIAHGTVTVVTDDGNVEVTTYRTDGLYLDHRTPASVEFLSTVDQDLKRRDFTVNAICYNPKNDIYDPENGIADLNSKIIRAIGDPDKRFNEDALRIMRAFRFSAQLGFKIENNTYLSAKKLSYLLKEISPERIFIELKKGFTAQYPENFFMLLQNGCLEFLNLSSIDIPDGFTSSPAVFPLRFALVCNHNGIDSTNILKALKADNMTVKTTEDYCKILKTDVPKTKIQIKQLMSSFNLNELYNVGSFYFNINKSQNFNTLIDEILKCNEPYKISMLAINGDDIKNAGFDGKDIGLKLNALLNFVIENPEYNHRDLLLSKLK